MGGLFGRLWNEAKLLPLLSLSLALVAGIAFGASIAWPLVLWGVLAFLALVAWRLWRGSASRLGGLPVAELAFAAALLAAACLGAARYQLTQVPPGPDQVAYYNDSGRATLVGVVDRPPVQHDNYTEVVLRAQRREPQPGQREPLKGLVLLRVSAGGEWNYGDRLRIRGELETPPTGDDFDYRLYLARLGIGSLAVFPETFRIERDAANPVLGALYRLRGGSGDILYQLYPPREAALLSGILLGDESGLSEDLKSAYNDSGLRHIIAISGFNITIIAGLLLGLFSGWLGPRRGAMLAAVGIGLYTLLVGADAAVMRAAIMGGLALFARQVGRRQVGLTSLVATAAVMALFNPLLLWDVGFQLSFAATLGIILYADSLERRVHAWLSPRVEPGLGNRLAAAANEYALITLAAQITTLPLLLYHFQRLSLVSLPANLLVLPAQPALMVSAGLSILLGWVFLPLGQLLSLFAWPLAAYSNRMAELFASWSGATHSLMPFSAGWLLAFYGLLFLATFDWAWLRARLPRPRPALVLASLAALTLWLWNAALASPDGRLTLTFLDVGGGEAVLVRGPEGRSILINGGPSSSNLAEQLGRAMPAGQRELDWLIVAGVRQEQLAGLVNSLEWLAPGSIAWAGSSQASFAAEQLYERAVELGIPLNPVAAGQRFDLGAGAFIEVVEAGARGAMLLIEMGEFRALLPLGLDFNMLEQSSYGHNLGSVDFLLLADNGYAPLNPASWLTNLDPLLLWLPVEEQVAPGLLELTAGRSMLRSDLNGWGRVSTDGARLWVEVGR